MEGETIKEEKKRLRRLYLDRRELLPEAYRRMADQSIAGHVLGSEAYRRARVLFIYVAMPGEIDTSPILERAWADGKTVGVPACAGRGVMDVYGIQSAEQLRPGSYGIPEPVPGCPRIEPGEIDLALLPCLSGTREGARLGYGGGYYDRYLPMVRGLKAILCRERLLADALPVEPHDIPADALVTENGAFSCRMDGVPFL